MIDYNEASKTYDNTRSHSQALIERFNARIRFAEKHSVLDFGCGTGNYLNTIETRFACHCCGVEPSDGMRGIAMAKNPSLDIRKGDHTHVPFDEGTFDFVFMTDVIHHIPNLTKMFAELKRVMKDNARLCIVTESHAQIRARFYNRYFLSLARNETQRYPDVADILSAANECDLDHEDTEIYPASSVGVVSESFVRNVEEKNFSMFRLLDEPEFRDGLARIKDDLGKSFDQSEAGETLVWLRKQAG